VRWMTWRAQYVRVPAARALTAPVPDGWSEHLDLNGNVFFQNEFTSVSTYDHPLDEHYRAYYLVRPGVNQFNIITLPSI
jgi:hypothetical protein